MPASCALTTRRDRRAEAQAGLHSRFHRLPPFFGFFLAAVATPAFAKGVEVIAFPTLVGGVALGLVGGAVSGGRGARASLALLLSLTALLLSATVFIAVELIVTGSLAGASALLFWVYGIAAVFGVIPLVLGFCISYFMARFVRAQVLRRGKESDAAS